MKELLSIREVSRLLNVPAPTLRFWEEKGLFAVKKQPNRYRSYTPQDLVRIADVMFWRDLGLSIRELTALEGCSMEEYARLMEQSHGHLTDRLAECRRMLERTERQQAHLDEVTRLSRCRFGMEEVPFEAVAPFDFREKEKLIRYAQDPSCYVRYFDTRDMATEARGILVPAGQPGPLLWEKTPGKQWLTFLIRERVEQNYASDVLDTLAEVRTMYRTGTLLARYLISANEGGERIDFLKAYLQVEPSEP